MAGSFPCLADKVDRNLIFSRLILLIADVLLWVLQSGKLIWHNIQCFFIDPRYLAEMLSFKNSAEYFAVVTWKVFKQTQL